MSDDRCAICGGLLKPAFVTTDRNRRITEVPFLYHRCGSCGTLVLADPPADLASYYPTEYYTLPEDRAVLLAATVFERYKVDLVRRFVPSGRLVEIGPAIGGFLVHAQEAGYDPSAIEMDARSCAFLRQALGIPCAESDQPARVVGETGPFDVIAMWHVLEHLPDPVGMLKAAAAALAPAGVIALAVPNPEAFQFEVLGARWAHVDAPRHLHLIPARELVRLGGELGLESVLLTFRDPGALFWNRFGWRESLGGFASAGNARLALKLAGNALSYLLMPWDRQAGRGSTYTLVLRRPVG